ncbi:MAG: hypothetical protein IT303_17600 [Dehalococcoidia bacterium]|nr:hypothetical protein [Dehalococcoidia bacterium]
MDTLLVLAQSTPRSEDGFGWPLAVFLVGFFLAIAALLAIIAWQVAATYRARMSVARESAYRSLAEQSASAITRTSTDLAQARDLLDRLDARTAEIERLLREVG